ncbi:hypothetical protein GQ54DRAFT_298987 [Martensiomyces pterosporus]|nr:hypothetical protein GQ54DRAFT_298987 [Martensiomyces pterosporus]
MPKRGIAIAGSGRDAAPYEAFLVIWVAGLPHSFTEDKIKDVFSDVGRIDKIRMAIDSKGRFLGKAEITYRLADDARSAVQVFDGETLYGADLAHVEPLRVTYSDIEKSAYLDNLKFENTLPEPKEIPLQMRLGVPGAQFVPYTLMPVNVQGAGQQAYSQERLGSNMGGRLSGPRRNQSGGYPKRRTDTSNESRPTPDQLDADLDAYMSSKAEGASAAAQPSAEPTQDSATAEQ